MLEAPLYGAGLAVYQTALRAASLRNDKARKILKGRRETFGRLKSLLREGDRPIWIHVSSLGEFEQARPLIEKIKSALPDRKIVLTFFSPSGYEVVKNFALADCVCYLPADTPRQVGKFLDIVNPEKAVFVKYEIWRNYLCELDRRRIPVYLICAAFRPGQMFFKRRSAWYGQWLRWFTKIFVQDETSKRLLEGIGITGVEVCGDTRFDRVAQIAALNRQIPEIEAFYSASGRKVRFMAGSSWPADEAVYAAWFNTHPEVTLIIAPHEFDDVRINRLCRLFAGAVLYSEIKKNPGVLKIGAPRVMVLDCFGLLSSAYRYCDVAYVGGGFGSGLHNINEAAVYGVPVMYGPNCHKFIEARRLAECGGGIRVESKEAFEKTASMLMDSEERAARGKKSAAYINSKLGATARIFKSIFE